MISFELQRDKGVLVIEPKGALTAEDFIEVARTVDPYILEKGKLSGLLIDAPSFPGWDSFAALIEHMKFVREHQRKIDRIAAVSDSTLLKAAPAIAQHFVQAKIRSFDSKDRDRALAWLENGSERAPDA